MAVDSPAPVSTAIAPVSVERIRSIIAELAADDFKGRRIGTPDGLRAADRVASWMGQAGLRPVGPAGFQLRFTSGRLNGVNVVGMREGTDPGLKDEVVVICAHHDHIGINDRGVNNGADDNASGVAALIEVAHAIRKLRLRRTVVFASFDGEETGLVGSQAFVKAGPFDPKSFAALICMDLVGGDFYPGDSRGLYALGAESGRSLRDLVVAEAARESDLEVRPLGIYAIEPMGPLIPRSDYASFRSAEVPFVFFSTGTPWYYHTPHDDPERINLDKLRSNVGFIARVLAALADAPVRPGFVRSPPLPNGDAEGFAGQMEKILGNPGLRIEPAERDRLGAAVAELRKLSGSDADAKVKGLIQRSIVALLGIIQRSRPEK